MKPSDDIERVAILIHDGSLPEKWAVSLGRLLTADAPATHTPEAWQGFQCEISALIGQWHSNFDKNDWTPSDIKGLMPHLRGRPVIDVRRGDVQVQDGVGTERIYRRPLADGGCVWEEGRRGA